MAKMKAKGKLPVIGNKKDGASPSKKGQVTALLAANKAPKLGKADGGARMKRMRKMEAADGPV